VARRVRARHARTGDAAKRYDTLVHSISAYYGLQYVFILCSYYIPVSLSLSRRIRELVCRAIGSGSQAPNEQTLEDWGQKSGLLLHDLRSYKTVVAPLARLFPGITGAAGRGGKVKSAVYLRVRASCLGP
jgi:hypothetical protein